MIIMNGKEIAQEIQTQMVRELGIMTRPPKLSIIQVGDEPASNKYISIKVAKAKEMGIRVSVRKIEDTTINHNELVQIINEEADLSHGVIVQLPLPEHLDKKVILSSIPPLKDVDGLNPNNHFVTPATPLAVMELINKYNVKVENKDVSVIGQSDLVGKPIADILEKMKPIKLRRYNKDTGIAGTEYSDLIIAAVGSPSLIKERNIKSGCVIIDVGINEVGDKTSMRIITGDVDRDSVGDIPSMISPVPGGVGPITVMMLFKNLLKLMKMQG